MAGSWAFCLLVRAGLPPGGTWGQWERESAESLSEIVTFLKKCVLSCSIHRGKENSSSISPGNPSLYSCSLQISLALGFSGFRLMHALYSSEM